MKPFSALNTMIEFNRTDLLGHPVCDKYLDLKWEYYGLVTHTIHFLFYATYVCIYTYFILSVDFNTLQCTNNTCTTNTTQSCLHVGKNKFTGGQTVSLILLLVYSSLSILLNMKVLHSWGWWTLLSFEKIAHHGMMFVVIIFVVPLLSSDEFTHHWTWEFGVLGLFMAWVFTLQHLKRTSPFGILIMMFVKVLATMTKILIVFSIQIIGLVICFHALLGNDEGQPFESVLLSFVRVFDMMIGEIDFINSFAKPVMDEDKATAHFQWATIVLVTFFILTFTIALMNLMIGLAIGDIEKMGKMAKYQQQKLIVAFYMQFEITFPMISIKYFDKNSLTVFPNKKKKSFSEKITGWAAALFGNIPVIEDFKNEAKNEPITLPIEARIFKRLSDIEKRLQDITEAVTAMNKVQIPLEATSDAMSERAHDIPDEESATAQVFK
ncbi:transient receptor potential cation channel subfamily A member 1-like [Anneissia japonica]|uniref:transient receptor potential cation channel subfamily A member 1-like n=1 Tax=Anneissia japonica TaxID=1529436 RepID=UPI001425AE71|nr:transient receptor potential cation channel subfamily A member 1-like [Anneissia japonica]